MPETPIPQQSSQPDSPLLSHLVAQLTVIKAQAQLIRRRIHLSDLDDAQLAVQERSIVAIETAVSLAMTQLVGAGERGRMPPDPLVEADNAA